MKQPVNTSAVTMPPRGAPIYNSSTVHKPHYDAQDLAAEFGNANDTIDDSVSPASREGVNAIINETFSSDRRLIKYPFATLVGNEEIGKGAQNVVFKLKLGDITPEAVEERYKWTYFTQVLEDNEHRGITRPEAKKLAEEKAKRNTTQSQLNFLEQFYKMRGGGGKDPFESGYAVALVSRQKLSSGGDFGDWLKRSTDLLIGYYHPSIIHSAWTNVINDRLVTICEYFPHVTPEKFRRTATVKDTVDVIYQIAVALNAFEKAGFVHRDIKPDNILIAEDGQAKLADFGIAKIEDGKKDIQGGHTLTMTGQPMGTPFYMSPEVARDAKHVDFRTDMFSLGATLYNLLTNKAFIPPIPRKDNTEVSVVDVVYNAKHWDVRPPKLTEIGMGRFFGEGPGILQRMRHPIQTRKQRIANRMLLERVQDIICTACSYYPNNRYQEWQHFRRDLKQVENPNYSPLSEVIKKDLGHAKFYAPLTSKKRS
jgi:serine/threonine protein kinase